MPKPRRSKVAEEPHPDAVSLSIPQAARRLGISSTKGYELANREENPLPTVRLGGRIVVPVKALERWIEEQAA